MLSQPQAQALFATLDVFGDGALHKDDLILALELDLGNLVTSTDSPVAVPGSCSEYGGARDIEPNAERTKETEEEEQQRVDYDVAAEERDPKEDYFCEGWVHVQKKQDWWDKMRHAHAHAHAHVHTRMLSHSAHKDPCSALVLSFSSTVLTQTRHVARSCVCMIIKTGDTQSGKSGG